MILIVTIQTFSFQLLIANPAEYILCFTLLKDLSSRNMQLIAQPRNQSELNVYQFIHLTGQLWIHLKSTEFTAFRSKNVINHVSVELEGAQVPPADMDSCNNDLTCHDSSLGKKL